VLAVTMMMLGSIWCGVVWLCRHVSLSAGKLSGELTPDWRSRVENLQHVNRDLPSKTPHPCCVW